MELIISNSIKITVKLFTPANVPITGITQPTIYAQKYNGSVYSITPNSSNWKEIDTTHMPGIYDLTLSSTDTNTLGQLKVTVKSTTSSMFLGLYQIVNGTIDSYGNEINIMRKAAINKTKIDANTNTFTIYDDDNTSVVKSFNLLDNNNQPTSTHVYSKVPV